MPEKFANYLYTAPEEKRVRVILDSDTACEADDPFAIAYALLSPKLEVRAVLAEHFARPGSMEESFAAARRLTQSMQDPVPVLRGEEWPADPERPLSEGVRFLIEEARRDEARPLFVLCLGALTNMARALAAAPDIAARLTIVTIGGRDYFEPEQDVREFNFGNDVAAANAVLRSKAPVWQIPICAYSTIRVGLAELQCRVRPCGAAGRYLFDQMQAYNLTESAHWTMGESWSLGDSPAVGVVLHNNCGKTHRQRPLEVLPDTGYGAPLDARDLLVYDSIDSRYILEDFFAKLRLHAEA